MSIVILSDVCKINMGQSPPSSSYNSVAEGLPFFQGNADFGDLHPTVRVWTTNPIKIAQTDDVLISVRAPIGALNMSTAKCCIGRGLAALTPDNRKIKTAFLFYYLRARQDFLNQQGSGAIFKAVTKTILGGLQINLPSLERQREIVRVLDKVEAVIDKHKRQLAKLDELAKARFVEMFAKKYDSVEVGRYLKTTSGGTPATSCPEYYKNGTIPWLTSSEVNSGIISKTKAYITEEGLKNSSAKYIPEDSIVIAMYGATAGQVGLLKIRCTTNQAVCAILPSERFLPAFLYYNAQYNKPWMLSQCAGGAQKNISQRIIRRMALYDAPLPLQRQFAEFVTHIERMKGKVRASLEATQKLLGSLMQEYFS